MLVTGIGQCSWDHLAIVDAFPEPDTKLQTVAWEEQGGGPVGTALVTLRRLGVGARFFGVTGVDSEGTKIRESLAAEGVDVAGLAARAGASSQKAFVVVERATGRRTIFWHRATGRVMGFEELGPDFLDGCGFLHLDGLMHEVSLRAARAARERGIPVMLDAGRMREGILELADHCDYIVGSETFARELGYADAPEAFLGTVRRRFPGLFTFTLGERGSFTFRHDDIIHQAAFSVDVVDTTGAGDVFHGTYIFGLLRGWTLRETLRVASAAAALSTTRLGGRAGIPTRDELARFLGRRDPDFN